MGDAAQLRIRGFPQGRYVRIRFKALPAEFVTNFRWVFFFFFFYIPSVACAFFFLRVPFRLFRVPCSVSSAFPCSVLAFCSVPCRLSMFHFGVVHAPRWLFHVPVRLLFSGAGKPLLSVVCSCHAMLSFIYPLASGGVGVGVG